MSYPIPGSKLFLSYASSDARLARFLKDYLEEHIHGLTVFMAAENIPRGEDWERQLHSNLKESFAFIPIVTKAWQESSWCFGEWVAASVLGEIILPFVDAEIELRPELRRLQHLKFDSRSPKGQFFKRLKTDVERIFSQHQAKQEFDEPPFPYAFRYEPKHAAIFRRPNSEVDKIVTQLNSMRHSYDSRALLLHGTSGSGKSSLVRAGVYPKLKSMQGSWIVISLFQTASTPFDDLLMVLGQSLMDVDVGERLLVEAIEEIRNASVQKLDVIWERVARLTGDKEIVLIVDNLDRYFARGDDQSKRLLTLLGSAIRSRGSGDRGGDHGQRADRHRSRIHVIGVLRSDQ